MLSPVSGETRSERRWLIQESREQREGHPMSDLEKWTALVAAIAALVIAIATTLRKKN